MKISLGSWSFCFGPYAAQPVPLEEVARWLEASGYDGIELSGFHPHVTPERYPTPASRRELRRFLADLGLAVSGFAPDLSSANPLLNPNRYLDRFDRCLEICVDLECTRLRIDTGTAPGAIDDADYARALQHLASLWHTAAGRAAQAGVLLVWEFEPGFAFNKPSELIALHNAVNHPNFKLLFDTAHAYMTSVVGARQRPPVETLPGGPLELLKKLQGRIGHVHLIDSDGTLYGDETSTHCPFGEGVIDFPRLAGPLLAIEGLDWWCVDLCFCEGASAHIGPSLQFLRELIATHARS